MPNDCVLCQACEREPHRIVFRDAHAVVMLNYEPVKPGHLMVLPVRHAENLADLAPPEAEAFLKSVDRCMEALARAYDETPMTLVNGWKFRTQPHLHAHVLPSANDLRGLFAAAEGRPRRMRAEDDALKAMAEALRSVF